MTTYVKHSRALMLAYADLATLSSQHAKVFIGTPGSVSVRKNQDGFAYYTHQFRDGGGNRERYVAGPVGDAEADAKADALRDRIAEAQELVSTLRMLGREGFHLVDAKTFATVAVLFNHGVFGAGGMLIGSHAFGAMLAKLGVRGAYSTEDVDIARPEALALPNKATKSFLEMLRESGVHFINVPAFDRGKPPTSFKEKGKGRFQVDLLVPSPNDTFPIVPIPELDAHATGLPYLSYLLAESQPAMLMSRTSMCTVRVPVPERYAVHKFVVSQLRTSDKGPKDLQQAVLLSCVLAELSPYALEVAVAALPKRMLKHFRAALKLAEPDLSEHALAELQER